MNTRILIVEKDLSMRPFWELILRRQFVDFHIDWAFSVESARDFMESSLKFTAPYALIVTELFSAGAETGLDLLRFKNKIQSATPMILVSETRSHDIMAHFANLVEDTIVLTKPLSIPLCEHALEQIFAVYLKQANI